MGTACRDAASEVDYHEQQIGRGNRGDAPGSGLRPIIRGQAGPARLCRECVGLGGPSRNGLDFKVSFDRSKELVLPVEADQTADGDPEEQEKWHIDQSES